MSNQICDMNYNFLLVRKMLQTVRSIDGWLSDREAILLHLLAQEKRTAGEVVEIGSYKGKSTVALALGLIAGGQGRVYAVDPHLGKIISGQKNTQKTLTEFKENIRQAGLTAKIVPVVKTSAVAASEWKLPVRLLFIDGLHDYEHVSEDYRIWSPFVADGGCIAFHDGYGGKLGVRKLLGEVLREQVDNIVSVGVEGSIVYFRIGKPTLIDKLKYAKDKGLILFSFWLKNMRLPESWQVFIIHRVIRFFLINEYDMVMAGGKRI